MDYPLSGIAVHRTIPEGHTAGMAFPWEGETFYITQAELDRVRSLPSVEEINRQVAVIQGIMSGK